MPNTPAQGFSGNGMFALPGVTLGEYDVEILTPNVQGAYVKSVRFGSKELTDGILRLNSEPLNTLEITLDSNAGVVRGNVFGDSGSADFHDLLAPLEGVRVVLVPDAPGGRRIFPSYDVYTPPMSGCCRFNINHIEVKFATTP